MNFATKEALRQSGVLSDQALIRFKTDVKDLYKAMIAKLKERSSLTYGLVNKMDSLNPHTIANRSVTTLSKKFEGVLMSFSEAKLLPVDECDQAERQYKIFVERAKREHQENSLVLT